MRINSINNIYNENSNRNNNQTSFTALKGVKFYQDFNPKIYNEDAKALQSFENSVPLKKFFERFDGYVEFYSELVPSFFSDRMREIADLTIKFNPNSDKQKIAQIQKQKNIFSRTIGKVKNFLQKKKEEPIVMSEFKIFAMDSKTTSGVANLTEKIRNLNEKDIDLKLKKLAEESNT